jgi:tRNA threonylcarbamoyladenosine biosynthesis protein TsaB
MTETDAPLVPNSPIVLALDTTTRAGSIAVFRRGRVESVFVGDPKRSHGERLPGDIGALLEQVGLRVPEIDLYAVVSGPGSFTGLRVGIAAIQGLALAQQKKVVAVAALEALALAPAVPAGRVGVWMDAQRQQLFAAMYDKGRTSADDDHAPDSHGIATTALTLLAGPVSWPPDDVVARWQEEGRTPATLVGDGVDRYVDLATAAWPGARLITPAPPLAPVAAMLAAAQPQLAVLPHAIVPVYVRASDAEIARDRPRPVKER